MAGSPRSCAETWQSERGLGGVGSGKGAATQTQNRQGRAADEQHLMDTSEDSGTPESASRGFYAASNHNHKEEFQLLAFWK